MQSIILPLPAIHIAGEKNFRKEFDYQLISNNFLLLLFRYYVTIIAYWHTYSYNQQLFVSSTNLGAVSQVTRPNV